MSDSITLAIGPTSVPVTLTGVKALGAPADIDFTVTPAGGSPVAVGSIPAAPDGAYSFAAAIPDCDVVLTTTTSATLSASASASVTVPPLPSGLVATIGSVTFDPTHGTNLGNYTDPQGRFVQGCVLCTDPAMPGFRVYFRSDTNGARDEVVFEYGDPLATTVADMAGYTATISKAGVTLATISVPQHFWFGRWRWQSAPRPVTTTPAALIAAGLLPHYDGSTLGTFSKTSPAFTYTPMTLAGLTGNMGQTGERGDIGPVTEWQADYIIAGTNLPTVLAQAEASGTFPWNIRDQSTGAPYDVIANPRASLYSASVGAPYIRSTACAIGGHPVFGDPAHEPALNYLPFLLTGDPYYLESLQFQATFDVLTLPPAYRYTASGAERAFAWSVRNAAQVAKITPSTVPSWLKPQSYWQSVLGNYLTWLTGQISNTSNPLIGVFATITNLGAQVEPGQPAGTYFTPWQDDFLAFVLCWAASWFPAWLPAATWKISSSIARANGDGNWLRAHPSPYYIGVEATPAGPMDTSWAAAYARNVASHPTDFTATATDPTNNAQLDLTLGVNITYPSYQMGALAFANRLGIAGAAAPLAWLAGEFIRQKASNRTIDRKWMVT